MQVIWTVTVTTRQNRVSDTSVASHQFTMVTIDEDVVHVNVTTDAVVDEAEISSLSEGQEIGLYIASI